MPLKPLSPKPSTIIYISIYYHPVIRAAIYFAISCASLLCMFLFLTLTINVIKYNVAISVDATASVAMYQTLTANPTMTNTPTSTPTLTQPPTVTPTITKTATITLTPTITMTPIYSPTAYPTQKALSCSYTHRVTSATKDKRNSFNAVETAYCSCGLDVCHCSITWVYADNPKNNKSDPNVTLALSDVLSRIKQFGGTCK